MFTGLTAEERASSDNTNAGWRLTCACANIEGLTPLQWLGVNGAVLPENTRQWLVNFKVAKSRPGSSVNLRIKLVSPVLRLAITCVLLGATPELYW